jgi:oligoendopeptidase F
LVRDILEYRAAEMAKSQHQQDASKISPALAPLYQEIFELTREAQGVDVKAEMNKARGAYYQKTMGKRGVRGN